MDRKSKIFLGVFVVIIVLAGVWKYYQFFHERNYAIYTVVSCDPAVESCFALVCEEGDEECDPEPYKKLDTMAYLVPTCDPHKDDTCPEPVCEEGSEECTVTYCAEETLEEGEECVVFEEESEEEVEKDEEEVSNEDEL